MYAHIHSTNGIVQHTTDLYSHQVATRVAAQAATLAGPSTTGPLVLVSLSNNPGTSADGPPGVVEIPPCPIDLLKGVHGHYIAWPLY